METQTTRRITMVTLIGVTIAAILCIGLAFGGLAGAATKPLSNDAIPNLVRPVVGMSATPSGDGYWLVANDGGIFSFGDARFFGSTGNLVLNQPVVGMASTPSGNGYWLVASDGGIFTFGDAIFRGSTGSLRLNQPVVGMAATKSGNGYWLVASDGGIFTFGDATFLGSTGSLVLNRPIVGMAATPTGNGYWLVASDGGIFTFGDAQFRGSTGATPIPADIVDIAATPTGNGYWLAASDGNVYQFGDAQSFGSARNCVYGTTVAMAAKNGRYYVTGSNAQTAGFSNTATSTCPSAPPAAPGASPKELSIAQEMFARLNAERAARGLAPLGWNVQLASRATSWSIEMRQSGFRHSDLHPLLGPFHIAAENIGTGSGRSTSGSVHTAWMRSTTHRVNLLAPNLDVVGIGVYCAPDGTMWATQNFGRFPSSTLPWDFGPTPPQDPIVRNDTGGTTCG